VDRPRYYLPGCISAKMKSIFDRPSPLWTFTFTTFLIPMMFHPRRWSHTIPSCQNLGAWSLVTIPYVSSSHARPTIPTPPLLTCIYLPFLTSFSFYSLSEYVEDFVSRIDISLLNRVFMGFFDQYVFVTPRLHDFLSCAELKVHNRAILRFWGSVVDFRMRFCVSHFDNFLLRPRSATLGNAVAQLCNSPSPPFSDLEGLQIRNEESDGYRQDNMEPWHSRWLGLIEPFSSMKNLYLSRKLAPRVALALQELTGERVTGALPALQNLFLEGHRTSGPEHEVIV
jgi:hypothetical protein